MSMDRINNLITEGNILDSLELMSRDADALMEEDKFAEALELWEKILEFEFDIVISFAGCGIGFLVVGQVEVSLCIWEKFVWLKSGFINSICGYTNALTKLNRAKEALPFAEDVLAFESDNVGAIICYGNALVKLGKIKDSLPWFEKAIQLEPNNVKAITKYANALRKSGKIEKSLPFLEKSLQLEPNNIKTITSYTKALMKLERVEESLPLFEKALQLEPNNIKIIGGYVNALIKLERVEESLPLFEKALQLEPNNIKIIGDYVNALIKLGIVEESFLFFEKALQMKHNNVRLIGHYANALMELGRTEDFCQFLEKLLDIKDNNYIRYKYATALEEIGQYQQAIEQLEKINLTNLSPYFANVIRLTLGRLYYSIKQPDKGNQYFQEAIDNSDESDKTLLYGARSILAENPYHQTAVEMLDKITQDSPRYADALKMLTLNLTSEEYFNRIDSETKLKDTQMLNRSMYHKIDNEIAILKSIAQRILRNYQDENSILNNIIEKLEELVEKIADRREIQEDKIDKIPVDNYREILSVISQTAHDISDFVNNELAVIQSKIRRAMRKIDSESKNYSQFEKLLTQLELTEAALSDLKAINEGITIKYKHFPVKKIFEKWQANNKIENAEIQLEIINCDSIFSGDEEKIKSALNEMVENSLKHNSYQQTLIIKMKSQDVINPEGIRGFTMPGEKQYLLIEFSDNGKGIPEDKKQWIFQPLTTTSKKGQGSGLGLYIIRRTLTEMQGHIQETGENGARFQMYIPYSEN